MNNTGMIRKIDNLGRIVIPKEVRKVLNIIPGDDLEIFCNGQVLELKKYSYNISHQDKINSILEILPNYDCTILITDREKVINSGIYYQYSIPDEIKELIYNSKEYKSTVLEGFCFGDININGYFYICPIIVDSFCNGAVIIFCSRAISKSDELLGVIIKRLIENM